MSERTANINIRIDEKTKADAEKLFKELGLNISTAINLFLKQSVRSQSIPFEVTKIPNEETLKAFEEAKEILKNSGKFKSYNNMDDLKKALLEE